jgi:hypothetical protein
MNAWELPYIHVYINICNRKLLHSFKTAGELLEDFFPVGWMDDLTSQNHLRNKQILITRLEETEQRQNKQLNTVHAVFSRKKSKIYIQN